MISRYNHCQTLKAVVMFAGGVLCCGLAFLFFRYLPVVVAWQLGRTLPVWVGNGIGILGLAAAWFSGYRVWKARGGLYGYHESGLYHDLGEDTSGAFIVDRYAHRVTAPAYVLGRIFMAGPVGILKARTLLASRIPGSPELEARLDDALVALRSAGKWQGLADYPGLKDEVLYLARMGRIDFTAHNGIPRFKIR